MRVCLSVLLTMILAGCLGKDNIEEKQNHFDLKGYFEKEAERLKQSDYLVEKTITQNKQSETREVEINDWMTELELFAASDINKPAWRDSYEILRNDSTTEYIAKDKKLRTQKIAVRMLNGSVKHLSILNSTSNMLYSSSEELHYYPDSLYKIIKNQDVQLLGVSSYLISSRFKTKSQ